MTYFSINLFSVYPNEVISPHREKSEQTDLLNIECGHVDDVVDVRASANLLHVGQIPFETKQLNHYLKVQVRNMKWLFWLLWKMLLQTFTIQTCRWQWGIWAAAEPDFAVQVPAHQMLSGHTAAADGAKPAGCCLEGVTAQEGSPPAWRHKTEEETLLKVCASPKFNAQWFCPISSSCIYVLLANTV